MTIKNPRLSAHLMIQPIVAERVFSDKELTGQGFMARFLIASPASIAGTRLYNGLDLTFDDAVIKYQSTINNLLDKQYPVDEKGTLTPRSLQIDGEAKALWKDAYDAIEKQLAPKMELVSIKPTAAKTAEQIIRIAGVLTLVDAPDANTINGECMHRAIKLGSWYLQEALRLTRTNEASNDFTIANQVKDWIIDKKLAVVTVNNINKNRVAKLNGAMRCREILNLIAENGWIVKLPPETMVDGRPVNEAWRLNRNIGQVA
jgi:hypothetical protein